MIRLINGKVVTQEEWDSRESKLQEIFDSRQAPTAKTDTTFLRGHCNGSQFQDTPWIGDIYKARAEAAGVDITGKVYKSSIASYPGDPTAWVDGRGDVKRVCEAKNLNCEGAVTHRATQVENKPVSLAPDIVDSLVADRLASMDPSQLAKVDFGEIAHEVVEKHKPHWAE